MASVDMCEHDWPGSGCKECAEESFVEKHLLFCPVCKRKPQYLTYEKDRCPHPSVTNARYSCGTHGHVVCPDWVSIGLEGASDHPVLKEDAAKKWFEFVTGWTQSSESFWQLLDQAKKALKPISEIWDAIEKVRGLDSDAILSPWLHINGPVASGGATLKQEDVLIASRVHNVLYHRLSEMRKP